MAIVVNRRLPRAPASRTRELFELAQARKDVINFGIGEPAFATPQVICDAAKSAIDEGYTHYSSNLGFSELREAIAAKLRRENAIPARMENVMVTVGAAQALFLAIFTLINEGDGVVVFEPAFSLYASLIELCGGRPIAVPLDESAGYHVDLDRLSTALRPGAKGMIVNSPHNPTGMVMRGQEIGALAELAQRHDLWVISDEVYEKIVYDGRRHLSMASVPGLAERTVTVNSFSKSFAMTGWRIGYLAAPAQLLEQMLKLHQNTVACANTIAQRAALAALRHSDELTAEMLQRYTALRKLFLQGIGSITGVSCTEPEGTFYAVLATAGLGTGSAELATRLLERHGVVVVPAESFGTGSLDFVRLSYCLPEQQLRRGLVRLASGFSDLQ
jgi:aspartate/methionine/tyrosine aminotransferase